MLPSFLMRNLISGPPDQLPDASIQRFAPAVPTFDPVNVPMSDPVGMPRFPALGQIETINQGRNAALEAFRAAQAEELAKARPQAGFSLTDGALLALGLLLGGRERGDFAKSFLQGKLGGFQQRQSDFDTGRRERLGAISAENQARQAGFGDELTAAQNALKAQMSEFEWQKRQDLAELNQDAITGRANATNETRLGLADKTTDRTKWKAQYDGFARVANNPNLAAEVRADAARRMVDMVGEDPSLSEPSPMMAAAPSVPERNAAVKEKELPSRIAVNDARAKSTLADIPLKGARTKSILADIPLKEARRKYVEKQVAGFDENQAVDIALKWARIDDYKKDNALARERLDIDQIKARNGDLREMMKTASSQSNTIRKAISSAQARMAKSDDANEKAAIQADIDAYNAALSTYRDLYMGASQALKALPGSATGTGTGERAPANPMRQDSLSGALGISPEINNRAFGGRLPAVDSPNALPGSIDFDRLKVPQVAKPRTPPADKPKPKVPPKKPTKKPAKKSGMQSFSDALKEAGWEVKGK